MQPSEKDVSQGGGILCQILSYLERAAKDRRTEAATHSNDHDKRTRTSLLQFSSSSPISTKNSIALAQNEGPYSSTITSNVYLQPSSSQPWLFIRSDYNTIHQKPSHQRQGVQYSATSCLLLELPIEISINISTHESMHITLSRHPSQLPVMLSF